MNVFNNYEAVIGLEVHAQLLTSTKAYSSDVAEYGGAPNTHVSTVTLGHPGTLPVLNKKALELAIKMGIACNCTITENNQFARKNYFYADLPKGYQITQDKTPLCTNGYILIGDFSKEKKINIQRIHLEEDAGKSIHDLDPFYTLVDLNRCGTPLIEIVTGPDLRSSEDAYQYITEIRKIVRYLDICDGNMEEGSLRCDANISVRLQGAEELGVKVEVKNMNSMRNVMRAIDFEVNRQIELIEKGGRIHQETRSFDAAKANTFSMRSKEEAHDYRYFPEPDLPPVIVLTEIIDSVKQQMPVLPRQLMHKYVTVLNLSSYDAEILAGEKTVSEYFEEIIGYTKNYKAAANWMSGPVKSWLNENAKSINEFPLKPAHIAEIISMINDGKINFTIAAQQLFPALVESPESDAEQIAKNLNLIQQSDSGLIEEFADQALAKYPQKVAEFKNGKKGILGLFMGEVMKLSGGKADPKLATKVLEEKLNS